MASSLPHVSSADQFYSCLLLGVASGAFAGLVAVPAVPAVTKVYTAPVVAAPAVATTVHHAPAVSKATRVVSYQSTHPGVPHTVAKVSTYTPAATAVHTVHAAVPSTVAHVVHHVPSYTYGYYPARYSYGHRYDYHPVRYVYGVTH
ncbi:hypothetical protein HPB50_008482 [Hyalomma asiaticum]|uniref:Uncharacterized protein n=1 Tax=Hyalomma asiaticum TaxID=266040 RepID=A0ACB7S7N1_HYAAI|nr:hypothetical protein HPB50_008482 [Hyalomma asiaticum]